MLRYTVRYAHLEKKPPYLVGDTIRQGYIIGKMGSTGKSTADHLHIDVVENWQRAMYRLSEMDAGNPKPCRLELDFFMDDAMFDYPHEITTGYNAEDYDGPHPCYDVVPMDRKKTKEHYYIYYNRSFNGIVLFNGYDSGYGNVILVGYEK